MITCCTVYNALCIHIHNSDSFTKLTTFEWCGKINRLHNKMTECNEEIWILLYLVYGNHCFQSGEFTIQSIFSSLAIEQRTYMPVYNVNISHFAACNSKYAYFRGNRKHLVPFRVWSLTVWPAGRGFTSFPSRLPNWVSCSNHDFGIFLLCISRSLAFMAFLRLQQQHVTDFGLLCISKAFLRLLQQATDFGWFLLLISRSSFLPFLHLQKHVTDFRVFLLWISKSLAFLALLRLQ